VTLSRTSQHAVAPITPLTAREYRRARLAWTEATDAFRRLKHLDHVPSARDVALMELIPDLAWAISEYERHAVGQPWYLRIRRRLRRWRGEPGTMPLRRVLAGYRRERGGPVAPLNP
jgi:hypothetical protein